MVEAVGARPDREPTGAGDHRGAGRAGLSSHDVSAPAQRSQTWRGVVVQSLRMRARDASAQGSFPSTARRSSGPGSSCRRRHRRRRATSSGALRTRHRQGVALGQEADHGRPGALARRRQAVADRGTRVVEDAQPGEPGPQAPVGVLVVGEELRGEPAEAAQGLGPEHRGGAAEPEALGGVVEAAVIGGTEAVLAGHAVRLEIGAGVVDEPARGAHRDRLAVDQDVVGDRRVRQRDVEGAASRGPAPPRRLAVDHGALGVVDPAAHDVLEDVGRADRDRPELAAEGSGVAGSVPGIVVEEDFAEDPVQDDLRGHRGDVGIGQHRPGGVDPARAGHGVVVEQPDDRAPGMAQAQVDAPREPEVGRGADDTGAQGGGHRSRLLARRPVVDHHDLVGLGQDRRHALRQPVPGTVRDDDHRGVRWHQRVATTFP